MALLNSPLGEKIRPGVGPLDVVGFGGPPLARGVALGWR